MLAIAADCPVFGDVVVMALSLVGLVPAHLSRITRAIIIIAIIVVRIARAVPIVARRRRIVIIAWAGAELEVYAVRESWCAYEQRR
jgi:hypothetical protein